MVSLPSYEPVGRGGRANLWVSAWGRIDMVFMRGLGLQSILALKRILVVATFIKLIVKSPLT